MPERGDFHMAVSVLTNTIADPDRKKAVEKGVLAGIGARPGSEPWKVRIFEPPSSSKYVIKIEGPNEFKWENSFFGPVEETPEFIRNAVQKATHRSNPEHS
jgi:hypothetical protein